MIYKRSIEGENAMIRDIIDNFNFDKVRLAMIALKWRWAGNPYDSPSIEELKRSAIDRMESAMDLAKEGKSSKATYFSSSGGIKASAWVNRYGHIEGIRLEFVLTDWDSDADV